MFAQMLLFLVLVFLLFFVLNVGISFYQRNARQGNNNSTSRDFSTKYWKTEKELAMVESYNKPLKFVFRQILFPFHFGLLLVWYCLLFLVAASQLNSVIP